MAFMIDEAFLPATLTARPMTDQQFAEFCAEDPDLFFEMTAEGEISVMPPNFSKTGARNAKITMQPGALGREGWQGNRRRPSNWFPASGRSEVVAGCLLDTQG